jgi:hypothetical protein
MLQSRLVLNKKITLFKRKSEIIFFQVLFHIEFFKLREKTKDLIGNLLKIFISPFNFMNFYKLIYSNINILTM